MSTDSKDYDFMNSCLNNVTELVWEVCEVSEKISEFAAGGGGGLRGSATGPHRQLSGVDARLFSRVTVGLVLVWLLKCNVIETFLSLHCANHLCSSVARR